MASSKQTPPVRRFSAFERLPKELGVMILKRVPSNTRLKVGQLSSTCAAFRLLTTQSQKKLCICFTSNRAKKLHNKLVPLPNHSFETETTRMLSHSRKDAVQQKEKTFRSQVYNSGIIINVDRLDANHLENFLIELGFMFSNLKEITILSCHISTLELRFINQALIQWSTGLEVLNMHLCTEKVTQNKSQMNRQWNVLLEKVQTMSTLQSLTIDCSEAILEKYRKVHKNKPLFPILATLRKFFVSTTDCYDFVFSSFEQFAAQNPNIESVGFQFCGEEMLFTKYANLGQQISSKFTHLNSVSCLLSNLVPSAVASFPSLKIVHLSLMHPINYKSTMAHLTQLTNLAELFLNVTHSFELVDKQIEKDTPVTLITNVKELFIETEWLTHGILKKLHIQEMFPNVEYLRVSNASDFCMSRKCAKLENSFNDGRKCDFFKCFSNYLSPIEDMIGKLGIRRFHCDYPNHRPLVRSVLNKYWEFRSPEQGRLNLKMRDNKLASQN